ncbi:single-stranded DNA-specific DHH superfamily exonuclease [Extensimonas vulgaris]|uniref:Single-stranded DNA-specific DHH superfamily exonuclease n=1 Tax=Extensimonas vulgaris TaxID=1031594 RepID=A0A369ANI9_9BURK|nr:single-stranded DNA-specific DHH superfamily exonuclease [Extensimonas vulgaris]TWI41383.1 single-stranded DNA-specific DHH superfamily exonuclease [Extensimonas vulgaris]
MARTCHLHCRPCAAPLQQILTAVPTVNPSNQPHHYDVCNGDADGLCAVRQWRLHAPAEATLVTGLKRDIALLERVAAEPGDEVLVCDIALARNRAALERLLARGVRVRYFDHHASGAPLVHPCLEAHLDAAPDVCTSVLVDRALGGRFRAWAVVGAFGDNLGSVAERLAATLNLERARIDALRRMGEAINYNAYGESAHDVLIHPAQLYALMARYEDPFAMLAHEPVLQALDAQRANDLAHAAELAPYWQDARGSVVLLPDAAWSRRIMGHLANQLANQEPQRAHALLLPLPKTDAADAAWRVSMRAPRTAPQGAADLCSRFGGSGRAAAGGIDRLPQDSFEDFLRAFAAMRWGA